ncbi:mediator of RNA polymerase ii transcription subunit 28 [Plakobranchus ocellatus]|uniref:Mediator of RNA polymerase II transcription subunit 28 n=1 Tax=Plakobranchus ocellatus TaxID=259542 RepID=A0AAV4B541_9GAST|nr:mediator of RNA polymerase ii transcription subunit 28 [Plakobranchus ocellatus]
MASSGDNKSSLPHLVDDFESAFQNCVSLLTSQEHFNVQDSEETKGGVENSIQRFLESARQMETFFLNKRLILSVAKPENVLSEDLVELKAELERKDALLEKHYEKLPKWQNLLRTSTLPPTTTQSSPYAGSQGGMLHQTMASTSSMPPSSSVPFMGGAGAGPPSQAQQMMSQLQQQQQQQPTMTPGQYPGPPAGHPGQYNMPPPAYPQHGPLASLERM